MKIAAAFLLCLPLLAHAQFKEDKKKEAGCKMAVDMALVEVRNLPTTPRDKADKERLQAAVEGKVKEMRDAKRPECEIWGEVNRIAVRF